MRNEESKKLSRILLVLPEKHAPDNKVTLLVVLKRLSFRKCIFPTKHLSKSIVPDPNSPDLYVLI
jgi:hypothetical protein